MQGPTHVLRLENLTTLEIKRCHRLRYIFTPTLALNLLQLKWLKIEECEELEQIMCEDSDEEDQSLILKDHLFFPNLYSIEVSRCHKLKYLFSITRFTYTQKLKILRIDGCNELADMVVCQLRYGFKNLEVLYIKKCGVNVIFEVEDVVIDDGQQHILSLPNLQRLHLISLPELQVLCKGPTHVLSLENLIRLEIKQCHRLRYIFTPTLALNLLQLKWLEIVECEELEQIMCEDNDEEDQTLILKDHLFFPNLQRIEVRRCHKLKYLFSITRFTYAQKLQNLVIGCNGLDKNLEDLIIENCGVKVIFEVEDAVIDDGQQHILSLPNLQRLYLISLPELQVLCKGPTHVLRLENLTGLYIGQCHRLRYIFTPTLAVNLLQLEWLEIEECEELEQIMCEDNDEEDQTLMLKDHLFFPNLGRIFVERCHKLKYLFPIPRFTCVQDHLQPLLWPNLEIINVGCCDNLKSLFPINKARGLQKPENSELEQVFGHKDVADVMMDHKVIMLPRLEYLTLQTLPSLTNFCHVGYHHIFSSLRYLGVQECPKMSIRFSYSQDDRSVHAIEKAPKTGNEDESAPAEISPEPATINIDCFRANFKKRLPPYMENDEQTITQQN